MFGVRVASVWRLEMTMLRVKARQRERRWALRPQVVLAVRDVACGDRVMTSANFIASFGMVIFFGAIVLLDWLGRRKDRRTSGRRT
jgi:hypothetical protein